MGVSYNRLWKLLIDRNLTKTELRLRANIGTATLAKMGKNQLVSMDVIIRICEALSCNISDVLEVVAIGDNSE